MRFSTVLAILPVVSAFAIVPRATDQTQAILKNLTTIENDIVTLNNTLNSESDDTAYNFFELNAIQAQSNQITSDVNSTAGTANSSTVATASESQQVLNEVSNNLAPKIYSLLNNLVAHKPGFDKGGISPTVLNSLQTQREQTRELGNALLAKTDSSLKTQANNQNNQILSHFDSAISAYS